MIQSFGALGKISFVYSAKLRAVSVFHAVKKIASLQSKHASKTLMYMMSACQLLTNTV